MDDNRSAHRQRVLKAGSIAFGRSTIDCVVRNMSDTGAGLDVASPVDIPENFVLLIPAEKVSRACRVMWRQARKIGVSFEQERTKPTRARQ